MANMEDISAINELILDSLQTLKDDTTRIYNDLSEFLDKKDEFACLLHNINYNHILSARVEFTRQFSEFSSQITDFFAHYDRSIIAVDYLHKFRNMASIIKDLDMEIRHKVQDWVDNISTNHAPKIADLGLCDLTRHFMYKNEPGFHFCGVLIPAHVLQGARGATDETEMSKPIVLPIPRNINDYAELFTIDRTIFTFTKPRTHTILPNYGMPIEIGKYPLLYDGGVITPITRTSYIMHLNPANNYNIIYYIKDNKCIWEKCSLPWNADFIIINDNIFLLYTKNWAAYYNIHTGVCLWETVMKHKPRFTKLYFNRNTYIYYSLTGKSITFINFWFNEFTEDDKVPYDGKLSEEFGGIVIRR
jgi:hypothetical protein